MTATALVRARPGNRQPNSWSNGKGGRNNFGQPKDAFKKTPGDGNRPKENPTARDADRPEPPILFQTFFKSRQRTYAAQVKRSSHGRPFLVLTDGRRDEKSGEIRKNRVFVFDNDFPAFFKMLQETAHFLKANRQTPGEEE